MFTITIIKQEEYKEFDTKWEVLVTDKDGASVFGYAPKKEFTRNSNEEIFKQSVETINLESVIKAINGIK